MNNPPKVSIVYSHKDRQAKDALIKYLAVMEDQGEIEVWHDNEMLAGDQWRETVSDKLADADILLYLTSAHSLASGSCNEELIEALADKDIRFIPVILEYCDWQNCWLSKFDVLPGNGKPVNQWKPEADGWQYVVDGIRRMINEDNAEGAAIKLRNGMTVKMHIGNFYMMLGNIDGAIESFSATIRREPDNAVAYNKRGRAYADKGERDLAMQDYDKAIEFDPHLTSAYISRGSNYARSGKYDLAIQDFSKAIEIDPTDATAYFNRGLAYEDNENYDFAISSYSKAIKLNPDFAMAYRCRGTVYWIKREYVLAVQDYNKAIELEPDFANAYYIRAIVKLALRDWEGAETDLSAAQRLELNIVSAFRETLGSIRQFEQKHNITIPPDIRESLEPSDSDS